MKNYNEDLIMALHSFFWYEGLLDSDEDAYIDFDKNGNEIIRTEDNEDDYAMSRQKYSDQSIIFQLINLFKNAKPNKYGSFYITLDEANALFGGDRSEDTLWHRYSML